MSWWPWCQTPLHPELNSPGWGKWGQPGDSAGVTSAPQSQALCLDVRSNIWAKGIPLYENRRDRDLHLSCFPETAGSLPMVYVKLQSACLSERDDFTEHWHAGHSRWAFQHLEMKHGVILRLLNTVIKKGGNTWQGVGSEQRGTGRAGQAVVASWNPHGECHWALAYYTNWKYCTNPPESNLATSTRAASGLWGHESASHIQSAAKGGIFSWPNMFYA